ncbi:hypothetical protein RRG08_063235 [Elysia crispata]|uniref:Uncharacterized protein n=1 Tax=Elysia crispata TaxID=231223 RepID=A0AAE0YAA7_9GAST|nr:hypothetical protein RRG08_063235 [Elysia crispata]
MRDLDLSSQEASRREIKPMAEYEDHETLRTYNTRLDTEWQMVHSTSHKVWDNS